MRRCPSCNKFCGVEQGEAELNAELEESAEGEKHTRISGDVRLVLSSECCGDEVAEANVDLDMEVAHPNDGDKHQLEITEESAEPEDRYDGEPNTPARYRRHFYGALVTLELKCSCGWTGTADCLAEESASGFEELG